MLASSASSSASADRMAAFSREVRSWERTCACAHAYVPKHGAAAAASLSTPSASAASAAAAGALAQKVEAWSHRRSPKATHVWHAGALNCSSLHATQAWCRMLLTQLSYTNELQCMCLHTHCSPTPTHPHAHLARCTAPVQLRTLAHSSAHCSHATKRSLTPLTSHRPHAPPSICRSAGPSASAHTWPVSKHSKVLRGRPVPT